MSGNYAGRTFFDRLTPSLRGAQRRSNPCGGLIMDCFVPLATLGVLAMTAASSFSSGAVKFCQVSSSDVKFCQGLSRIPLTVPSRLSRAYGEKLDKRPLAPIFPSPDGPRSPAPPPRRTKEDDSATSDIRKAFVDFDFSPIAPEVRARGGGVVAAVGRRDCDHADIGRSQEFAAAPLTETPGRPMR